MSVSSCNSNASMVPAAALLLAVSLVVGGCDESLPPRDDPEQVLLPGFRTSVLVIVDSTAVRPRWGTVYVSVTNLHDEVLQADALVRAQLTVRMAQKPEIYRTLEFNPLDLVNRSVLRGQTLTIGVDSLIELYRFWDHRTSDSTFFWDHVVLNRKITDKGVVYYESDSVMFLAEGTIQAFKNVQRLKVGPVAYPIVYQIWDARLQSNKR